MKLIINIILLIFILNSCTLHNKNQVDNVFINNKVDNVLINNKEKTIKIINSLDFIKEKKINNIDLLKIDTEGYEYYILKGFDTFLRNVRAIYFEHHFDLMIKKGYKFSDINQILLNQGFKQKFKYKMIFRKSFEYIYINNKLS